MDPPPELNKECLTEAECHDKGSRNEEWRAKQHKIRFEQAKDFERVKDTLNPVWTLDMDGIP